jgi:hypothetical protein
MIQLLNFAYCGDVVDAAKPFWTRGALGGRSTVRGG